jgi:hypothetical protein
MLPLAPPLHTLQTLVPFDASPISSGSHSCVIVNPSAYLMPPPPPSSHHHHHRAIITTAIATATAIITTTISITITTTIDVWPASLAGFFGRLTTQADCRLSSGVQRSVRRCGLTLPFVPKSLRVPSSLKFVGLSSFHALSSYALAASSCVSNVPM